GRLLANLLAGGHARVGPFFLVLHRAQDLPQRSQRNAEKVPVVSCQRESSRGAANNFFSSLWYLCPLYSLWLSLFVIVKSARVAAKRARATVPRRRPRRSRRRRIACWGLRRRTQLRCRCRSRACSPAAVGSCRSGGT